MELKIENDNVVVFLGMAEEYLELNDYDTELEVFLSEFEASRQDEVVHDGLTFYRELSLVWEDKEMDYEKASKLYDLLSDLENYTKECRENETDTRVLHEIQKTLDCIDNIKQILSLEF